MNTRFIKNVNGRTISKLRKNIVIDKITENETMQIFNPTDEMLYEDGWELYIKPEPTEEEILANAKRNLINEIEDYDSSNEVNIFYIQDMPVWLDKATRAGLKLRFDAEIAMGKVETTLWYENMQFPLLLENAIKMLYAIEVYASACYDNTQAHLTVVEGLQMLDDINEYNYREGYPEKLRF